MVLFKAITKNLTMKKMIINLSHLISPTNCIVKTQDIAETNRITKMM